MVKTSKLISVLEDYAPMNTSQPWDNSGWQINLGNEDVTRVMTALTVTDEVLCQAVKHSCDFIVSHHPVFFDPVKKIEETFIIDAIKNSIQIYSLHTNLDIAKGGTSDILAKKAGFNKIEIFNDFVRFQSCAREVNLPDLLFQLKKDLGLEKVKLINNKGMKTVKNIAFCAGAGGSFISELKNSKIDIYVTGDVKYHEAIDAGDLVVLDIGHFESEKYVHEIFKNILRKIDVEVVAADEKNVWQIV